MGDREEICLISDRHAGIKVAIGRIQESWERPRVFWRLCMRHVISNDVQNFKGSGREELKNVIWRAATTSQIRHFNQTMKNISTLNKEVHKYLVDLDETKWTFAHDGGHRYGVATTNNVEVFNGVIKGARFLPITAAVRLIFYRLVSYFNRRRNLHLDARRVADEGGYLTPIVPEVYKMIANAQHIGLSHKVISFNVTRQLLEITDKTGDVYIVNLQERTCNCGLWNVYKIPCSHAFAGYSHCRVDVMQGVDDILKIDAYEKTWEPEFFPIAHPDYWPEDTLPNLVANPIRRRTNRGKGQSTRRHNEMDWGSHKGTTRCSICKQVGHDRRTCSSRSK